MSQLHPSMFGGDTIVACAPHNETGAHHDAKTAVQAEMAAVSQSHKDLAARVELSRVTAKVANKTYQRLLQRVSTRVVSGGKLLPTFPPVQV